MPALKPLFDGMNNASPQSAFRSSDKIFRLEIIDGKLPKSSTGLIDNRLFKDGEDSNRLRLVWSDQTGLWNFKYEKGAIPPALSSSYTTVSAAKKFAETYFANRNIRIAEVIST